MLTTQDQTKWVIIDNDTSKSATIIQVSNDRHEILFETTRIITNFKLIISKAYRSCEDGWFLDVYHVVDLNGQKIQDEILLDHLYKAIAAEQYLFNFAHDAIEVVPHQGYTMILLRGIDRPGLLCELWEALAHHGCHIVYADMWTHRRHGAAAIYIADELTGFEIKDGKRISRIKKVIGHIMKPSVKWRSPSQRLKPKTAGRLYEVNTTTEEIVENPNVESRSATRVTVTNCKDRDYTLVEISSDDRIRLLLDTVTALMVMQYVVFHGTVTMGKTGTCQEYYIRHINGCSVSTMGERKHLQKVLELTIDSPESEGVELEVCTDGQLIQLSEIVTVFRDKGCWIKRAQICTVDGKAKHNYWITDVCGKPIDSRIVDSMQEEIGENIKLVKKRSGCSPMALQRKAKGFLFDNPFKRLAALVLKFFNSNHSA